MFSIHTLTRATARKATWLPAYQLLTLLIVSIFVLSVMLLPRQTAWAAGEGPAYTFPQTGHTVSGRFLTFWNEEGGLAAFGFPIGEEQTFILDGHETQVQYFERTRFEYHPENQPPYDVLLGRMGAERLAVKGEDWTKIAKDGPAPTGCSRYETGFNVCEKILTKWRSLGLEFDGDPSSKSFAESLALVGNPITPLRPEQGRDGVTRLTQWFERARFEIHPENAGTPYEVLLGLLGRETTGPDPLPPSGGTHDLYTGSDRYVLDPSGNRTRIIYDRYSDTANYPFIFEGERATKIRIPFSDFSDDGQNWVSIRAYGILRCEKGGVHICHLSLKEGFTM